MITVCVCVDANDANELLLWPATSSPILHMESEQCWT